MPVWKESAVFVTSLLAMAWATIRLNSASSRIGARYRFSESLMGIVTAMGAGSPEIASAVTALLSGHHEVGLGVVLGSNIFNLAGILGLSAVIAGSVTIGWRGLWFNGSISLVASLVAGLLVLHWIPAWASLALLVPLLVAYVALMVLSPSQIARLKCPSPIKRFITIATGHPQSEDRKRESQPAPLWKDLLWVMFSLVLIVGSSIGVVRSAVFLGSRWGISQGVLGTLVLASLTSLPNVVAAVQLARDGRGAAVISETLNSNNLNILAGICIPSLLVGLGPPIPRIIFAATWLLCMKCIALAVASRREGLHRTGGALLLVLYVLFAVVIVLWE